MSRSSETTRDAAVTRAGCRIVPNDHRRTSDVTIKCSCYHSRRSTRFCEAAVRTDRTVASNSIIVGVTPRSRAPSPVIAAFQPVAVVGFHR